jgi:hypothetical protein
MTNCHLILVRPMQIAFRLLIVAYVVAAIAWGIALIPPRLFAEDSPAGMLIVIGFGYSQVFLALLFLMSAILSAVVLVRRSAARSSRSFLIFGLAFASFVATSLYSWFYWSA